MKLTIKNRRKQKIVVVLENPKGNNLAIVMHGLGGYKDQPHIRMFADAFKESGFIVLTFDTTNSFGESDGKYEDATITNYYEDLEDVIAWAKKQKWYMKPFFIAGHSLGGVCTAMYAQKHPEEIKGLAPISTFVSGKLSLQSPKSKNEWKKWKKDGWHIYAGSSGVIKRLPWSHYENRLKYDLIKSANKIKTPTLMIVGSEDTSTPMTHNKKLYSALKCQKEFHIIKGAPHTFKDKEHLDEIKKILKEWIGKTK